MIVLDDLKDLISCYPASEEYETQERLRTIFHRRQEDIHAWHQHWTKGKELAEATAQEEAIAAKDMGHDLSYYREASANAINNYKSDFYSQEKLLDRTNAILRELTGLRVFFENLASTNTIDLVTHARCDARAEMLGEEIITRVIRQVAIKENADVRFDVTAGGLTEQPR
jgi:hypothetical protein